MKDVRSRYEELMRRRIYEEMESLTRIAEIRNEIVESIRADIKEGLEKGRLYEAIDTVLSDENIPEIVAKAMTEKVEEIVAGDLEKLVDEAWEGVSF